MRVAYVTLFDATDVKNWSGTDLHAWKALQAQGAEITLIGNLVHGPSLRRRLRKLWSRHIERRSFLHFWDTDTAKAYAADVADRLREVAADAVVSPSPVPLAYLHCRQPKILWTDATYAALCQDYDEFKLRNVSSVSATSAMEIDRAVARNCELLLYASEWGARNAIELTGADPQKVAVVPYGANIRVSHNLGDIATFVSLRGTKKINLLFIGVDWHRKGASKAIEVTQCLRKRGIDAELTIVGCSPPQEQSVPAFCHLLGFIDKTTTGGQETINQLYRESHFLIVPTAAEAYGLVFAEASAFGVPSLSHRIGGVPTIVRENVNGCLFDKVQPPDAWADWIVTVLNTPDRLQSLAASSFHEYQARLNWESAGRDAAKRIATVIATSTAAEKNAAYVAR